MLPPKLLLPLPAQLPTPTFLHYFYFVVKSFNTNNTF
jgi:hypothetical protein